MILFLADLLDAATVADLGARLAKARFVDGRVTAGKAAREVKQNLQVDGADPAIEGLRKTITEALKSNALFGMAARPRSAKPILFSRYEVGMEYGSHIDNAVMNGLRADLSFTIFLSDPTTYDGGALVIESTAGEQEIRLPAGHMVLYPSTTLHRVSPVTRGVRLAAVGWVRSLVRDDAKREILFDIDTARQAILQKHGKTPEYDLISKSMSNLLRRWVED